MSAKNRQPLDAIPLDAFRVADDGKCWWCGSTADTSEHKFKRSDLKRVAGPGNLASNVYKFSETWTRELHSLDKGTQVRWSKNLCKECNNSRSQPFDLAYDRFVQFLVDNPNQMETYRGVDWSVIYGTAWQAEVLNLSRYLAKQFGCMMATENLPVPHAVIDFLNGSMHEGSLIILIYRDLRMIQLRKQMLSENPTSDAAMTFIGLPPTQAYLNDGELAGADYALRLGYLMFTVEWRAGVDSVSIHDVQRIKMPLLNSDWRSRLAWRRFLRQQKNSDELALRS